MKTKTIVVRPKILKVAKEGLKDTLKSYVLRPVLRSVELDEPLDYLTEMRRVVILFVNAKLSSDIDGAILVSLVKKAYGIICK